MKVATQERRRRDRERDNKRVRVRKLGRRRMVVVVVRVVRGIKCMSFSHFPGLGPLSAEVPEMPPFP